MNHLSLLRWDVLELELYPGDDVTLEITFSNDGPTLLGGTDYYWKLEEDDFFHPKTVPLRKVEPFTSYRCQLPLICKQDRTDLRNFAEKKSLLVVHYHGAEFEITNRFELTIPLSPYIRACQPALDGPLVLFGQTELTGLLAVSLHNVFQLDGSLRAPQILTRHGIPGPKPLQVAELSELSKIDQPELSRLLVLVLSTKDPRSSETAQAVFRESEHLNALLPPLVCLVVETEEDGESVEQFSQLSGIPGHSIVHLQIYHHESQRNFTKDKSVALFLNKLFAWTGPHKRRQSVRPPLATSSSQSLPKMGGFLVAVLASSCLFLGALYFQYLPSQLYVAMHDHWFRNVRPQL